LKKFAASTTSSALRGNFAGVIGITDSWIILFHRRGAEDAEEFI
jgi:hypothetical protein